MGIVKYIKNATKELHHVVWPTHKETKKYMTIVTVTIILSAIFVYLLSLIFETSFFALRNYIKWNDVNIITTENTNNTKQNIQDLVNSWAIKVETWDWTKINIKAESVNTEWVPEKTKENNTQDKKEDSKK